MCKMLSTTTLITGCNRGIGLEMVRHMLAISPEKYTDDSVLVVTCRDPSKASELEKLVEQRKERPKVLLRQLDVEKTDNFNEFVQNLQKDLGAKGLGLLINNAGLKTEANDLESITAEDMMSSFKVNTIGPLLLTQAFLKELKKAASMVSKEDKAILKKPMVLNLSTKMGSIDDNTSGGIYPYRASKTALNMVTKSMSVDLGKHGINAFAFHPGWVKTDMGGPNALISLDESVNGLWAFLESFKDDFNGGFYDYKGEKLSW